MHQVKGIRQIYGEQNRNIIERIIRKKIDTPKVMESYASGIAEEHIRILYRLDKDEMSYILRNYLTHDIINRRKENQEQLDNFEFNLMGLAIDKLRKTEKKLTIQEAIALVEGKGERED